MHVPCAYAHAWIELAVRVHARACSWQLAAYCILHDELCFFTTNLTRHHLFVT
jgi:hypothetical protein